MIYTFIVYAGYHQFYLMDADPPGSTGADDFWTPEAYEAQLAVNPGIIGVGTGTYGEVPVEVEIASAAPEHDEFEGWDRIVEGSLTLQGHELHLTHCPGGVAGTIPISAGSYRVRVYTGKLDSVINEEGDDHYRIVIWPEPQKLTQVLKQWQYSGQ